jgi:hypothetical protein
LIGGARLCIVSANWQRLSAAISGIVKLKEA